MHLLVAFQEDKLKENFLILLDCENVHWQAQVKIIRGPFKVEP